MKFSSSAQKQVTRFFGNLAVAIQLWSLTASAQTPTPTPAQPPQAPPEQPSAAARENWRKEMQATPRPRNGCFTATYPERQWREVPCKTPPNKLYPPRQGGTTRLDMVGGAGPDFSAVVSRYITQAEGSFDTVTGVSSECDVQCPNQVCPTKSDVHWCPRQLLFSTT